MQNNLLAIGPYGFISGAVTVTENYWRISQKNDGFCYVTMYIMNAKDTIKMCLDLNTRVKCL